MQQPPDSYPQYPRQQWQQPLMPQQQQWNPQQPYYSPPYQQPPLIPPKKSHKTLFIVLGVIFAVVLFGCIGISALGISALVALGGQAAPTEQIANSAYLPVDGIYCDQLEQTGYHIHAHLTIWIDGQQVQLPQSIGIASDQSCLYCLHTHDSSGVIHIEAPNKVTPTLGNFLDIWGQKFQQLGFQNELASTAGWTVYVDGKKVNSTFDQLVLQPHMVITIAYNSPNITPDSSYTWQAGQ